MKKVYNFSAGPSMLPKKVMMIAKKNFRNWNNLGISVLEISHRSEEFVEMTKNAEKILRNLLLIPHNYKVLFCHGGARGQFSAVPMNLLNKIKIGYYINTGFWSFCAAVEAKKFLQPNIINVRNFFNEELCIQPMKNWSFSTTIKSSYIHYCPNETMEGIAIHEEPNFDDAIVVGDFSSTILSRKIDVKKYGIIYAGAQKNIGPSGITLVIIREDLLKCSNMKVPSILNYELLAKNSSMFNTPSTFSWYLSSLVFHWIQDIGGISKIEANNEKKSKILYDTIDSTDFYINKIKKCNRSKMNVVFNTINPELDKIFLKESHKIGLLALKGHLLMGGMRASIYNAMSIKGVKKLINFMVYFEKKYG